MNKPIKAKNLPLFSIIDLNQLRRENHLEGTEVTDFFTARDGKVYLLMEQPSETQGKDLLSCCGSSPTSKTRCRTRTASVRLWIFGRTRIAVRSLLRGWNT